MFDNEPGQFPPPPAPPPPAQEIHTMPERFLDTTMKAPSGGPTPSGGRGRRILIILVILFVLGALGAGAWYYFTRLANQNVTANANGNVNVNRNANVNRNVNRNVNENTNVNANINANANVTVNTNANLNTNVNANVNTNTSTTTGSPLPTSTDTDNEGLTDFEEAVYGTQANNNDSDGDGFIDGMRTLANGKIEGEVYLGYCPTKAGNVRLDDEACGIMKTYTNPLYNYALWVPKNWLAQTTTSDQKTLMITPDIATTEFFQVIVLENPTQLSAKNYYLNLNPGVDATKLKDATVNGIDGVLSLDESAVYFVKGTNIYVVSYNSATLTQVNLRTTFIAMYRSFHLVSGSATNTNTNTSTNTNSTTNANSNTNSNTNSPPVFQ